MRWLWRMAAEQRSTCAPVRLPPLWLFGALAAMMLIMAAPKDIGDVFEYHCYALDFWHGAHVANTVLATPSLPMSCSLKIPDLATAPFQELPREYGPLSLLVFSLPLLAPLGWYNTVFYALMCGVILGIAWLLDRYGPRGAGHIWLLYTLLGVMLEAAGRFDALPAAAVLIALLAAQRGRSAPGVWLAGRWRAAQVLPAGSTATAADPFLAAAARGAALARAGALRGAYAGGRGYRGAD